ncbi:CsbD family protein [Psychrobacter sp. YP14]|uniref:CsbD family protein n=3 Tax=Psychrobacter TaxID=497 RepID=A0A844LXV9_9GAMM|nr:MULTISPECIES: CsbD family protein [Psychrobacter]AWT48353.1 CsbD family protein [Psychrobacter sp. YP14]MUG31512.1 CsbD family protein [Psychrobacter sanguinis]UNK05672.1 CsbD family protein [Psychrobacter sp. PraFG1]
MNKDTFKGEWKQLKGNIKQQWAELTDDDLTHAEGSFDKLVGRIQERYGDTKEKVEQQVHDWRTKHDV